MGLSLEKSLFRGEIKFNEPMSAYTSLKIGGPVDIMVIPEDAASLKSALAVLAEDKSPFFIMGGGTNILVKDKGIRGCAISMKSFNNISPVRNPDKVAPYLFPPSGAGGYIVLFVEAGVPMGRLVNYAKKNGYSGIEALAGIPGTFGGAVSMNAGSFGTEIREVIVSVALMSSNGEIVILKNEDIEFSYRSSNIAQGSIILSANIALKKDDPENVAKRISEYLRDKRETQPVGEPSAGCVFKNPEGGQAGRLIDAAGCKGMKAGGIEVSSDHANYFVNKGGGTHKDFIRLMKDVTDKVAKDSGVRLEPEIKIIGRDM